jgi:hypothetical protein
MREHTRNALIFYVGVPAVVGFLLGSNKAGFGQFLPWGASVVFWVTCTFAAWIIFHLGTLAAAYLLKPWEPPLIAKLAVGLLIASIPSRLLINLYAGLFTTFISEGHGVRTLQSATPSLQFAIDYAKLWSGPYVLWISTNILFDRVVGFSRYSPRPRYDHESDTRGFAVKNLAGPADHGRTPAPEANQSEDPVPSPDKLAVSQLLSRLPPSLGFNIMAVKSEDHYLRVHTDNGDALILYKLSGAIEELEALGYAGLRVHRSYWVRREAIASVSAQGRQLVVNLNNGLTIPVSHTYREMVRLAGLI